MIALESIAVVVTLLAVYLTARQVIWCWPLGMISVALYAVVFYQSKLYADMGLQAIYFALAAYGWWAWLRGGGERGTLQVSVLSTRARVVLAAAAAVAGRISHNHARSTPKIRQRSGAHSRLSRSMRKVR